MHNFFASDDVYMYVCVCYRRRRCRYEVGALHCISCRVYWQSVRELQVGPWYFVDSYSLSAVRGGGADITDVVAESS